MNTVSERKREKITKIYKNAFSLLFRLFESVHSNDLINRRFCDGETNLRPLGELKH